MPKRTLILIGVAALLAVVACGVTLTVFILRRDQEALSRAEAERLLRTSSFMAQSATTKLVLYQNILFPAADLLAEHGDMVKFMDLGLVEIKPHGVWWGKPIGAKFVLTAEGERAAAAGWQHTSGPAGEDAWIVPTARKEFLEMLPPTTHETVADCTFRWEWVSNKIGEKTGASKGPETASARFHRNDERWYLDENSIIQIATK